MYLTLFTIKEKPSTLFKILSSNKLLTKYVLCSILTDVTDLAQCQHELCQFILTRMFLYENAEFLKMNYSQRSPRPCSLHDWLNNRSVQ